MSYSTLVAPLVAGRRLEFDEAAEAGRFLTSGDATPAQVGAFLGLANLRGTTGQELAGLATALRERSEKVTAAAPNLIDTCGTGGGSPSFNISTGAAIVAAAAGAKVAKHGNRAITSRCGSADVLEALGVRLESDPARLGQLIDQIGIAFLFAPHHHPAMRHVGPARREIGFRTVFNLLGPLTNPAGAANQVIGVFDPEFVRPVADALEILGARRALVVHGSGLDEVSAVGPTIYEGVWDGERIKGVFSPTDFGLSPLDATVLDPGDTVDANAAILKEALSGKSARSKVLIPSAAIALWVAGLADSPARGGEAASEILASGAALHKLEELTRA